MWTVQRELFKLPLREHNSLIGRSSSTIEHLRLRTVLVLERFTRNSFSHLLLHLPDLRGKCTKEAVVTAQILSNPAASACTTVRYLWPRSILFRANTFFRCFYHSNCKRTMESYVIRSFGKFLYLCVTVFIMRSFPFEAAICIRSHVLVGHYA